MLPATTTATAVRIPDVRLSGKSQTCGRRARRPPTIVPSVLKTMSLSAGSLPGTTICAISTTVERNSPQSTAIHVDREFHPTARPSGTNRQRLRIPSASQRRSPPSWYENGSGGPLPDGRSVSSRIATTAAVIASARVPSLGNILWPARGDVCYFGNPLEIDPTRMSEVRALWLQDET